MGREARSGRKAERRMVFLGEWWGGMEFFFGVGWMFLVGSVKEWKEDGLGGGYLPFVLAIYLISKEAGHGETYIQSSSTLSPGHPTCLSAQDVGFMVNRTCTDRGTRHETKAR